MIEKWGVEVPRWQLYRARILANEGNEGSHTESFKFLKKYMENLKSVNLKTIVKFEHYDRQNMDDVLHFKRVFVF